MNFNAEISRVDCTRKFSLEASVVCDELPLRGNRECTRNFSLEVSLVCDELQLRDIESVPENSLLRHQ